MAPSVVIAPSQPIHHAIRFYKENDTDRIWWVDTVDTIGLYLFSFDRKKIYNLFSDYPHKLSAEEKRIFDEENPYWKAFFGA